MAFKSEIHVAELASIRTGHTEGDIYYILDNGMLDELPCKPGDFVKWHNDTWQMLPDEHYALASDVDGEIATAIGNILDDGSTSESIVVAVPSSQADDYTVGEYYKVQNKVAKLRTKTAGDNVTQLTFDTTTGLLQAINETLENGGKVELFNVRYNQQTSDYNWPTYADIDAVVTAGKLAALKVTNPAGYVGYYWLTERPIGTGTSYTFYGGEENCKYVRIYFSGIAPKIGVNIKNTDQRTIAPMYSSTSTYAVDDAVMYDGRRYICSTAITTAEEWTPSHWTEKSVEETIGNVEALLAAL